MSMKPRVVVGASTFASEDKMPLELLTGAGLEVVLNPHGRKLTEDETIAHFAGAVGVLAGLEPINRKVLSSAPTIRVVARIGIGMDNVDQTAANDLGIKVSNTPDAPTEAVAEMTLAALLTLSRRLVQANASMHSGEWKKTIGSGLKEQKVLLIGLGRIGRRVAELLHAFGAVVMASDPALTESTARSAGVRRVSLDEGLAEADVISLHAGGNSTLLGHSEFGRMKSGVTILNSARGALVDEAALIAALKGNVVSQAWFDVFAEEPYRGALTQFPQVLLTPHISSSSRQCRLDMETAAVKNLLRDLGIAQWNAHAT